MAYNTWIDPKEYQKIENETAKAIKRGLDHSAFSWKRMAYEELYRICVERKEFTVNDFRARIRNSEFKTHDNRAMGGIMRTGAKFKWIEKTGEEITSRVGHLSPLQVWKSLIYKEDEQKKLQI